MVLSIESMVKVNGWEMMEGVVKVASETLRRVHNVNYDEESTDGLWKRTEMLSKFFSIHSSESTRPLLEDCVKDMIAKLERPDRIQLERC